MSVRRDAANRNCPVGFHDPAMVSMDPNHFLKFRSHGLGVKSEDCITRIDKQTLCNTKNILIHQLVPKYEY